MGGKKELEKIMLDYVRWIFRLDFYTPRYLITRELRINKLKIKWGFRTVKYAKKIRKLNENRWLKKCWSEKENEGREDLYSREKRKYYNRNGWEIEAVEDLRRRDDMKKALSEKEWDVQIEENKIRKTKYNKNVDIDNIEDMIRALLKIRCRNMEEMNKYWVEEEVTLYIFCGSSEDCIIHYIKESKTIKNWFKNLGTNYSKIESRVWSDEIDVTKDKILRKIWREKEIIFKNKKRG
ncbi:hypothetical protein ACFW04_004611 [Cataglyphis niger]